MSTTRSRTPTTLRSPKQGSRANRAEAAPSFRLAEANADIGVARGSPDDQNIPLAISDEERKLFSALFGSLIEQILAEPD
jgi:hypothetical protein